MGKTAFDSIMAGLQDAIAIGKNEADPATYRVHRAEQVDVRAIRTRLGLTQAEFARRFRIALPTLRKWERGERQPEGPACAYLKVIAHDPAAVERALSA